MSKIFSIVVTFNGEKWIRKCLDSLVNSSVKSDIIVVDNNSHDLTKEIVMREYPDVQLIESARNLGFGKANNVGLKRAIEGNAEYVVLLNQDSWINKDTMGILMDCLKTTANIGVIAPVNLNASGSEIEKSCAVELSEINCPEVLSDLYLNKLKSTYFVNTYINASCWLLTGKCVKTVGGFDPLFSHYGEDVNYCMRVRYHDFTIAVNTKTNSFHAKDNYVFGSDKIKLHFKKLKQNYLNNHLLNKLTDIHLTYAAIYIEEVTILILLVIKYVLKLRFKMAWVYLKILGFVISKTYEILKHRNDSKKEQSTFLN